MAHEVLLVRHLLPRPLCWGLAGWGPKISAGSWALRQGEKLPRDAFPVGAVGGLGFLRVGGVDLRVF